MYNLCQYFSLKFIIFLLFFPSSLCVSYYFVYFYHIFCFVLFRALHLFYNIFTIFSNILTLIDNYL